MSPTPTAPAVVDVADAVLLWASARATSPLPIRHLAHHALDRLATSGQITPADAATAAEQVDATLGALFADLVIAEAQQP